MMGELEWRCHVPNLLSEIMSNPGAGILAKPLTIFGHMLHDLAELAVEIDDPRLHLKMMDFALYESGDPLETDVKEIDRIRNELLRQIDQMGGE